MRCTVAIQEYLSVAIHCVNVLSAQFNQTMTLLFLLLGGGGGGAGCVGGRGGGRGGGGGGGGRGEGVGGGGRGGGGEGGGGGGGRGGGGGGRGGIAFKVLSRYELLFSLSECIFAMISEALRNVQPNRHLRRVVQR